MSAPSRLSPLLTSGQAEDELRSSAPNANKIYIFELFVAAAAIIKLRKEVSGRKIVRFVYGEADCAALAKGAARNRSAWTLVCFLRAVAARYEIAFWIEGASSKLILAGLPPGGQPLPFSTEPRFELPELEDIPAFCDLSRVLQHRLACFPHLPFPPRLKADGSSSPSRALLEQATCGHHQLKAWPASGDFKIRARAVEGIR